LEQFPAVLQAAGTEMNPSLVANYAFQVAKMFNSFYAEHSIKNAATAAAREFRLQASYLTGIVLKNSMAVLGIQVPDRM
jgi:arginyl-tRNA synthetase